MSTPVDEFDELPVRPGQIIEREYSHVDPQDGARKYYIGDKLHRKDGPAIERLDGSKSYWIDGKLHRDGGPAIISPNGTKIWYQHGELHRDNGPAIEYKDGRKEYYLHNKEVDKKDLPKVTTNKKK